jgi:CubicO group peptidase (beta-lactamase class C family)
MGLNRPVERLDVARYMYGQPLQYAPGTNSAYSNYGYLLLSAIVEQVSGMPYFNYLQQYVLAPLGITQVVVSSTQAQQRDPNQAICEDQGQGFDPINLTSNLLIPAVYGGDGQIKEVAVGCAGLAASATALTQFIHVNLVWGNGLRPNPPSNWWLGRTGSTPGTSTAEIVRKHYGKWSKGRQDNIDRFMIAHFQTALVTVPVTPQSHKKMEPEN